MYKFLLLCLWLPYVTYAQTETTYYTSNLKDKNGRPLIGATIVNTTTHTGTSVDYTGSFRIKASVGDVLNISAVGYNTSQVIVTRQMLQGKLKNNEQPVSPIISSDYITFIRRFTSDSSSSQADTTNNISMSKLRLSVGSNAYLYSGISNLTIHNNQLSIQPAYANRLSFGGSYSSTAEIKRANQIPDLQNIYAQGRPLNGQLTWQGPETGEIFSFGPAINTLHYDGSNYAYDVNGKLTNGSNGKLANTYGNSIFRTAFMQRQNLNFHSTFYKRNAYQPLLYFSINAGQTGQDNIIQQNRNTGHKLNAVGVANIGQISITGTYSYQHDQFSNSNRNGFLSKVYQSAILTPVNFSNQQGYLLPNRQRSFSLYNDNPYFLLTDNSNSYSRSQHNTGLTFEKKGAHLSYKIAQSFEAVEQQSNEAYKFGSAAFESGISTNRVQQDSKYSLQAYSAYSFGKNLFSHIASASYIFTATQTAISYTNPANYFHYQRSLHDAALAWSSNYSTYRYGAGSTVTNKFYFSNTSSTNSLLLPSVSAYLQIKKFLDVFNVKLVSSWHSFVTELPINQSLGYTNLLQYTTQQSSKYFPTTEVSSYNGLQPIKNTEWNGRLEIDYKYRFTLSAEVFQRNTRNDIFAIYEAGKLNLKNIADHKNQGIELQLNVNGYQYSHRKIRWSGSYSFVAYNTEVTHVEPGYSYLPIAGFSDVHKTLVEGKPLGSIVGSAWLKDKNGNKIIGTDGFPLVDPQLQIIGNPTPDFIVKTNHEFYWKAWKLQADLEWKKGGDIWNGTQAVLDYYGRSKTTAALRNTTDYVFDGVMQNGSKNNTPVNFLDVSKPVEANRWTRYGYSGVAEAYIQKSDYLRVPSISLSYRQSFRTIIQSVTVSTYINNLLLWSRYKGADPAQLLYDQPATEGLDFFNVPSAKSFGINATIQF